MSTLKKLKIEDIQFYNKKQVAEILSYSVKSIDKFVANGSLPSVKIRGKRLISSAQIKKFLESSVKDGVIDL